jgi:hypothetical protein
MSFRRASGLTDHLPGSYAPRARRRLIASWKDSTSEEEKTGNLGISRSSSLLRLSLDVQDQLDTTQTSARAAARIF